MPTVVEAVSQFLSTNGKVSRLYLLSTLGYYFPFEEILEVIKTFGWQEYVY